jgi:hypothetical protein
LLQKLATRSTPTDKPERDPGHRIGQPERGRSRVRCDPIYSSWIPGVAVAVAHSLPGCDP